MVNQLVLSSSNSPSSLLLTGPHKLKRFDIVTGRARHVDEVTADFGPGLSLFSEEHRKTMIRMAQPVVDA